MYNGADYVYNAADTRLTLVNANLPYTVEPTPLLDIADETTGQQLEAEAAMPGLAALEAEAAENAERIRIRITDDVDFVG